MFDATSRDEAVYFTGTYTSAVSVTLMLTGRAWRLFFLAPYQLAMLATHMLSLSDALGPSACGSTGDIIETSGCEAIISARVWSRQHVAGLIQVTHEGGSTSGRWALSRNERAAHGLMTCPSARLLQWDEARDHYATNAQALMVFVFDYQQTSR